jgi:murein DD-endopeptidase / murein LD-carboxypeptidase
VWNWGHTFLGFDLAEWAVGHSFVVITVIVNSLFMLKRMLLTAPAALVFGIVNAQPLPDYSRDTIRVTAQWSHQGGTQAAVPDHRQYEARTVRMNAVVSASPVAQMAVMTLPVTAAVKEAVTAKTKATAVATPAPVAAPEAQLAPQASEAYNVPIVSSLLSFARKHLYHRYRSGGDSPKGFDCSGFVYFCFTKFGLTLPHSSAAQASIGAKVEREFAQPGDLIFFKGSAAGGRVGHVGIITEVVNNQIKFIHSASSGGVKYDALNADYYRKRFVTIRRVAHMLASK